MIMVPGGGVGPGRWGGSRAVGWVPGGGVDPGRWGRSLVLTGYAIALLLAASRSTMRRDVT